MNAKDTSSIGRPQAKGSTMLQSADLRLRTAWYYYHAGETQQEISERLGISRSTVIKLLDEARRRGEVQIWVKADSGSALELGHALERDFGLQAAIVVPESRTVAETAAAVGAGLGQYLSRAVSDGQVIGLGWGSTLSGALTTFRPNSLKGVRVLSLLGGAPENRTVNPAELAWRMAGMMEAECLLLLAPLVVDSPDTKRRLIEKCGLDQLIRHAGSMDIAVISCGIVAPGDTTLSRYFLSTQDQTGLITAGATCETLCHFLTDEGTSVEHPLHDRLMSVGLDSVAKARQIVLASGGLAKANAIRATIKRVGCHVLVTDEAAARELIRLGPL